MSERRLTIEGSAGSFELPVGLPEERSNVARRVIVDEQGNRYVVGDGRFNPGTLQLDATIRGAAGTFESAWDARDDLEAKLAGANKLTFGDMERPVFGISQITWRPRPLSWRVRLQFAAKPGAWVPEPPPAPTALAATDITHNSFWANWEAVAGATLYRLDVATDSEFNTMVLSNQNVGDVTTYEVLFLDPETDYWYRVRAENAAGASANSNVIAVTTTEAVGLYTDTYEDVY